MRLQLCLVLSVMAFIGTIVPAQNCIPYWTGNGAPIETLQQMHAMAVFDDGGGPMLYAAGRYLGGSFRVARWNGTRWEVINDGLPAIGQTGRLMILDEGAGPRLHLDKHTGSGGGWTLMRWGTGHWEPATPGLGTDLAWPYFMFDDGAGPVIFGVAVVDPGTSARSVVRWDGQEWHSIGQANSYVTRFAAFDDGGGAKLHVAGWFASIGGTPAARIARWTGSVWEPLGTGLEPWGGHPRDMIVHNDGNGSALYVADVLYAAGSTVNSIARWDGQNWSDVGGGILPVGIVAVHVLASFDDGRGPALFAGGYMSMAGGNVPVRQIARFDGTQWDDVGGGLGGGYINSMAVYDDGRGPSLFVGGTISRAGGGAPGSIYGIAQWVGCPSCYANCTNRQTEPRLTVDDFTCFIDKFAYGDPYVDCNQDGQRTIDDFHCFIARFAEGCP